MIGGYKYLTPNGVINHEKKSRPPTKVKRWIGRHSTGKFKQYSNQFIIST